MVKYLNDEEWAAICAIHQVPNYKFVGQEIKLAKKLVLRGLLKPDDDNFYQYKITRRGETLYKMSSDGFGKKEKIKEKEEWVDDGIDVCRPEEKTILRRKHG